jgi:hypothetical protein
MKSIAVRCTICDYVHGGQEQSTYFKSLPEGEQKAKRYVIKAHGSGEPTLGCKGCASLFVRQEDDAS